MSTAEVDARVIKATRETISELGLVNSAAKIAPAGALLMAMYGQGKTRGKTSILGIDASMNQACAVIRPAVSVDVEFLLEYLRYKYEMIRALSNSGGQENLSLEIVKTIPVLLPELLEQERIRHVLGDVGDLIDGLNDLIAKKRAVKQGMMQHLLTGRMRLYGFASEWESRKVTEMGAVLAGKALNAGGPGELRPYLRTKNVLDGRINLSDVLAMPMTGAEFQNFGVKNGDILLNEGQSLDLVGRCSLYGGEFGAPCAMQNQLLRFRAYENVSPNFAAQLFRHCQKSGIFASIATQTTSVAHLGSSRFGSLHLRWPVDRREQDAIANVLDDADCEIDLLESRVAKFRAIKAGMMQQLLSGRTRLHIEERVT